MDVNISVAFAQKRVCFFPILQGIERHILVCHQGHGMSFFWRSLISETKQRFSLDFGYDPCLANITKRERDPAFPDSLGIDRRKRKLSPSSRENQALQSKL